MRTLGKAASALQKLVMQYGGNLCEVQLRHLLLDLGKVESSVTAAQVLVAWLLKGDSPS